VCCDVFHWEITLKKTLGRLAGAVLAGAVLSLAVTPVAMAQIETTTPPAASTETTTSVPPGPSYSGGPVTTEPTKSSTPASSSSQQPTPTSGKPTSGKPSPTSTSEKPTTSVPPKPVLNVGAGYVEGNEGALAILCGSEPTDVSAPDYTVVDSFQDGGDAYLWIYIIEAKPGFKGTSSTFTWTCDGKPGKGDIEIEGTVGGGATAPGTKPKKQVKLKPKGGIETGFGATAA